MLPDILERQVLSLNLLSKLDMSLIIGKHFVVLENFRCPSKALTNCEIVHYRTSDYTEPSRTKIKQCNRTE